MKNHRMSHPVVLETTDKKIQSHFQAHLRNPAFQTFSNNWILRDGSKTVVTAVSYHRTLPEKPSYGVLVQ